MTLATDYQAIINGVVVEVEKHKSAGHLTNVIVGQKATIPAFPVGFVIPVQDAISIETTRKVRHHIGIKVVIVNENTDPEAALDLALDEALAVYDDLVDDRSLGGTANDVQGISFEPDYSMGASKTLAWVVITINCHKVRVEG